MNEQLAITRKRGLRLTLEDEEGTAVIRLPARTEDLPKLKACEHCNLVFLPKRTDQRFCGVTCRVEFWQEKRVYDLSAVKDEVLDGLAGKPLPDPSRVNVHIEEAYKKLRGLAQLGFEPTQEAYELFRDATRIELVRWRGLADLNEEDFDAFVKWALEEERIFGRDHYLLGAKHPVFCSDGLYLIKSDS